MTFGYYTLSTQWRRHLYAYMYIDCWLYSKTCLMRPLKKEDQLSLNVGQKPYFVSMGQWPGPAINLKTCKFICYSVRSHLLMLYILKALTWCFDFPSLDTKPSSLIMSASLLAASSSQPIDFRYSIYCSVSSLHSWKKNNSLTTRVVCW